MNKETLSTSEKEVPKHRNALSEKYEEAKKIGQEAEPLNPENIQKQKVQEQFNQDMDELGRETDSLVEEIDKWQT